MSVHCLGQGTIEVSSINFSRSTDYMCDGLVTRICMNPIAGDTQPPKQKIHCPSWEIASDQRKTTSGISNSDLCTLILLTRGNSPSPFTFDRITSWKKLSQKGTSQRVTSTFKNKYAIFSPSWRAYRGNTTSIWISSHISLIWHSNCFRMHRWKLHTARFMFRANWRLSCKRFTPWISYSRKMCRTMAWDYLRYLKFIYLLWGRTSRSGQLLWMEFTQIQPS
jgi:hypothetical protein